MNILPNIGFQEKGWLPRTSWVAILKNLDDQIITTLRQPFICDNYVSVVIFAYGIAAYVRNTSWTLTTTYSASISFLESLLPLGLEMIIVVAFHLQIGSNNNTFISTQICTPQTSLHACVSPKNMFGQICFHKLFQDPLHILLQKCSNP